MFFVWKQITKLIFYVFDYSEFNFFYRKITPYDIYSLKICSERLRKSYVVQKSARILIFSMENESELHFLKKNYSENFVFSKNYSETCFLPRNWLQNSFFVFKIVSIILLGWKLASVGPLWACFEAAITPSCFWDKKKNIHLYPERASKRKLINLEWNFMKKINIYI